MSYSTPQFCDDQPETMKYTLSKADGSPPDQWMIWDGYRRTLQGLAPISKSSSIEMKVTGTDADDYSVSTNFKIFFLSKPCLNKAIENYSIRTEKDFQCFIPRNTFLHPNNDQIKYSIS
jgi:hypothetical protein